MTSKEQLINEAQYALGNANPGSTGEQKYRARANKLARYILRRHPDSMEARQARRILRQLGEQDDAKPQDARKAITHTHRPSTAPPSVTRHSREAQFRPPLAAGDDDSWGSLWQTFSGLSQVKKQTFAFIAMFAGLILFFTPFLFLVLIYYAFRPASLRKHLRLVLNSVA